MLSELDDLELDFVFLSETHDLTDTCIVGDSNKLYCSLDSDTAAGVAILILARVQPWIRRMHRVSDRVVAVD